MSWLLILTNSHIVKCDVVLRYVNVLTDFISQVLLRSRSHQNLHDHKVHLFLHHVSPSHLALLIHLFLQRHRPHTL